MPRPKFASVNDYIASQPPDARKVLTRVRTIIRKALPNADEVISYQIPAVKVDGRTVLYFAGFKEHFSLYPSSKRLEAEFAKELAPYETSGKGTIRFPLNQPIPGR
jgi:uncharacterized protein YdhG (YjbR/CyaY superfamily)